MLKSLSANKEINLITSHDDLKEIFLSGYKSCSEKKAGIEFEKPPINKNSFKAASYQDVSKILADLRKNNWDSITEKNALLGLKNSDGTVTLEPGSQTELSLTPRDNIHEIKKYIDNYNRLTANIAEKHGVYFLGYGIQPVSTYGNIKIIPKKRYEFMTKYLPTVAKKPLIMMRETSGIQSGFDYENEEDAIRKFSTALKLSPIISSAYSNSPIRNGRLTKFKSNRSASWLETDNDRCGLVSSKAFCHNTFSFDEYIEILLDVPMIFIERNISSQETEKTAIKVENLTFRQFIKNGYNGFSATKEDWELHLSLYFPDVRFKSYIEIRNHDNQRSDLICSIPALWKGIIYNNDAMNEIDAILKNFSYFDFEYLRRKTPQKGLDIKIKHYLLRDIVLEIFKISYNSLKTYGKNEEIFLEPMMKLIEKGITPADIIINKWENEWNHDLSKFVEYSRLK